MKMESNFVKPALISSISGNAVNADDSDIPSEVGKFRKELAVGPVPEPLGAGAWINELCWLPGAVNSLSPSSRHIRTDPSSEPT